MNDRFWSFDAQYSSYLGESFAETQAINRIERAKMGFKRATYTIPRYTRQVELKFEPPITSMPTLDYSVFPPRVTRERPNRTLVIELEMPADQERVLFITDEQEMKDFENFRKLKDVAARIKTVNAEIDAHEASASRANSAASRSYEEKARLRREQKDLTLKVVLL